MALLERFEGEALEAFGGVGKRVRWSGGVEGIGEGESIFRWELPEKAVNRRRLSGVGALSDDGDEAVLAREVGHGFDETFDLLTEPILNFLGLQGKLAELQDGRVVVSGLYFFSLVLFGAVIALFFFRSGKGFAEFRKTNA